MSNNYGYLVLSENQVYALEKEAVTIGRGADCDLLIDELRVSRNHARLTVSNGVVLLNDLSSSGGTDVNNHPIVQKLLTTGDMITLAAHVRLMFRANAEDLPEGWTAYIPPIKHLEAMLGTGPLDPGNALLRR